MKLTRILIAGDYENDLKEYDIHKDCEMRFLTLDHITMEDLLWAEAYVGSQPCHGFSPTLFKWVHTFNAGVNNFLDIDGWKQSDTILTRTICSFGQRISEYCLSYVLRDLQSHQKFQSNQEKKEWNRETPSMLRDLKVVIFGTGKIGQEVAKTFSFFDATVYGISRTGEAKPYFREVCKINHMTHILGQADVIISTLPLTDGTKKILDSNVFRQLRDVMFINVGRGATVDEEALVQALENNYIRQAILDVFATEPLPPDSKWWSQKGVTITPHISAVTVIDEAIECFINTLQRLELEKELPNQVNVLNGY